MKTGWQMGLLAAAGLVLGSFLGAGPAIAADTPSDEAPGAAAIDQPAPPQKPGGARPGAIGAEQMRKIRAAIKAAQEAGNHDKLQGLRAKLAELRKKIEATRKRAGERRGPARTGARAQIRRPGRAVPDQPARRRGAPGRPAPGARLLEAAKKLRELGYEEAARALERMARGMHARAPAVRERAQKVRAHRGEFRKQQAEKLRGLRGRIRQEHAEKAKAPKAPAIRARIEALEQQIRELKKQLGAKQEAPARARRKARGKAI